MTESGKENDRRPVDSVEERREKKGTRENCDVEFIRDRTLQVI